MATNSNRSGSGFPERADGLSRRRLFQAGGSLTAVAAAGIALPSTVFGSERAAGRGVEIENLGPGNFSFPLLGSVLLGDTMYVGSRNLSPTRVAGFHVPTRTVVSEFTLGNGNFVQSLATDGNDVVYAGVNQAQPDTNLYRCNVRTGEVTEAAAVPGQSVAALAVASDGMVYTSGRPEGRTRGPALFSYDPVSGELTNLGVPNPDTGQCLGLAVTDTTVYFGCGASSVGGGPAGLFAVDRVSGAVTDILPPELAGERQITKAEVFGDILVVGGGQVGVLDLVGGGWRLTTIGGRQHQFTRSGDVVFGAASDGLYQIELNSWTVSRIGDPGGGFGDYQAVDTLGESIIGTMSGGYVWTLDRGSSDTQLYDVVEAGASGGGEAAQSVGVVDDKVYVGGNNSVAVHDRSSGSVKKLAFPGEVKDMVSHAGVMYMATYAPAALWAHDASGDGPARQITGLPPNQNRPRMVKWDAVNELVVIGIRSDSTGGGSLCLYDPVTDEFTAHIDPLGRSQWVWNVAPAHGLVYIAGANPGAVSGDIAAWDPIAGKEVWRMENPLGENGGVSGLTVMGRWLFGTTAVGPRFFVIDIKPSTGPELVYEADFSEFGSADIPLPVVLVDRGIVYGTTYSTLFRVDTLSRVGPATYEPTLLLDDLDSDWFSGPHLAVDDDHNLYTLTGTDLIRVRDRTPR